jgi:hypothetical protein
VAEAAHDELTSTHIACRVAERAVQSGQYPLPEIHTLAQEVARAHIESVTQRDIMTGGVRPLLPLYLQQVQLLLRTEVDVVKTIDAFSDSRYHVAPAMSLPVSPGCTSKLQGYQAAVDA